MLRTFFVVLLYIYSLFLAYTNMWVPGNFYIRLLDFKILRCLIFREIDVQVMDRSFNYLFAPGIYYSGTCFDVSYSHFVSYIHSSVLAQSTRNCNLRCKYTLFQKVRFIYLWNQCTSVQQEQSLYNYMVSRSAIFQAEIRINVLSNWIIIEEETSTLN